MDEKHSIITLMLLGSLSASLSGNAISDEPPIKEGAVLKAGNSVVVRESPPTEKFLFFVGRPGKEIQQLPTGQTFKVEEVKTISVPLGADIWVKGKTSSGKTGWIYYGDKEKSVNFEKRENNSEGEK